MDEEPVKLNVDGAIERTIKGVFSWNGSRHDLRDILSDYPAPPGNATRSRVTPHHVNFYIVPKSSSSDQEMENVNPTEADPSGASTFVIAVILIYGFSIIFLIASSVFKKKRAYYKDSEKNINNYLEQAGQLRDESKRESFKKLKWSLIPVLAQSPSGRALIAKRVKYTPYLVRYVPFTAVSASGKSGEQGSTMRPITIHRVEEESPLASTSHSPEGTLPGNHSDSLDSMAAAPPKLESPKEETVRIWLGSQDSLQEGLGVTRAAEASEEVTTECAKGVASSEEY